MQEQHPVRATDLVRGERHDHLPSAPGAITVGSADFPESEVLADVYGDAMSAKGVSVTKKLNIGERPAYIAALKDGSIKFIPEYTGSILAYFDTGATQKTPDGRLRRAAGQGAERTDSAEVRTGAGQRLDHGHERRPRRKYHLTSIADLASVAGSLTLGAPAQFKTRADGVPALKSVYGVTFGTFTPLSAGGTVTVKALKSGSIDAADIFSTDPAIVQNGFVSLTDPKSMFAAQNVVPLATQAKLSQPMVDACNAVSAKLDTATLAKLVADVAGGKDPDTVAKTWLSSMGLG